MVPANGLGQTWQGGLAAGLGMGGPAIEIDIATKRIGVFGRLFVPGYMVGTRVYVIGERNSAFYVSGAWAQLRCATVNLGGAVTGCDGRVHTAWALLGGTELGSPKGKWSIFVDAGPYFGARDAGGLRDWTFVFGVRHRPRFDE